jgi:hypothetical protein
MQESLLGSCALRSELKGDHVQLITSRTVIAAITTTIAAGAPITQQLSPSIRPSLYQTLDDRRPQAEPCLVGTQSCLSLYQTPPAPCLLSTKRCPADGHIEFANTALSW